MNNVTQGITKLLKQKLAYNLTLKKNCFTKSNLMYLIYYCPFWTLLGPYRTFTFH